MKWQRFKHRLKRYWVISDIEPLLMLGIMATLIAIAIAILDLLQGF